MGLRMDRVSVRCELANEPLPTSVDAPAGRTAGDEPVAGGRALALISKHRIGRAFPRFYDLEALAKGYFLHKPRPFECVCCGTRQRFRLFGLPPRLNARCPNCRALERHRLLCLFLNRNPDLWHGREILHFAPEKPVRKLVEPKAGRYLGADLDGAKGDAAIDVERMDLEDASFDVAICCHVLEHVDDARALAEFHRVLRPGGVLLAMVPIIEGWEETYEDPAIRDPAARQIAYGQIDHVRFYGRDFRDRVRAAGFSLEEFTAVEPDVSASGLKRGEKVFIARRS